MLPTAYPTPAARCTDIELHRPMDVATQHRLAGLYADLAEVRHDRAWATAMNPQPLPAWLAGIDAEERDVWDHIVETITGH